MHHLSIRRYRLGMAVFALCLTLLSGGAQTVYAQDCQPEEPCYVAANNFGSSGGGRGTSGGGSSKPLLRPNPDIKLLQPLDDSTNELPGNAGIAIFFDYANLSWPWIIGVAAGLAVLQALRGGIEIMISGGDSGKRENGISRFQTSLAGLLIIGLAGLILSTLNPLFFQ